MRLEKSRKHICFALWLTNAVVVLLEAFKELVSGTKATKNLCYLQKQYSSIAPLTPSVSYNNPRLSTEDADVLQHIVEIKILDKTLAAKFLRCTEPACLNKKEITV